MNVDVVIADALAELPRGLSERLFDVRICTRRRPNRIDRRRGASRDALGYFWGSAPAREPLAVAAPELPDRDPAPAVGEIVIFHGNIRPLTPEHVRKVVFHEVGHALGYDHEEMGRLGLC